MPQQEAQVHQPPLGLKGSQGRNDHNGRVEIRGFTDVIGDGNDIANFLSDVRYVWQREVYVLPQGSEFHFEPDCPRFGGEEIERNWDAVLLTTPPVARRIGGMNMNRARPLVPCPICACAFRRFAGRG